MWTYCCTPTTIPCDGSYILCKCSALLSLSVISSVPVPALCHSLLFVLLPITQFHHPLPSFLSSKRKTCPAGDNYCYSCPMESIIESMSSAIQALNQLPFVYVCIIKLRVWNSDFKVLAECMKNAFSLGCNAVSVQRAVRWEVLCLSYVYKQEHHCLALSCVSGRSKFLLFSCKPLAFGSVKDKIQQVQMVQMISKFAYLAIAK